MPPKEYRSISKDELLRKYLDEGWQERLAAQYKEYRRYSYSQKTTELWLQEDGQIAAIVNTYKNGNIVVRQLRDGDILYYIPDPYRPAPAVSAETATPTEKSDQL